MPRRETIGIDEARWAGFGLWNKQWLLLTAGELLPAAAQPNATDGAGPAKGFNAMTVSWGGLGYMWNKPLAIVVVRPQRFTYQFIERYDTFTLAAFPAEYHKALELLGTRSGRAGNKIAEAGLTPIASTKVAAPGYAEAELIVECRKMYWQDLDPAHFLRDFIPPLYGNDYHRVYWGEVLAISATADYMPH